MRSLDSDRFKLFSAQAEGEFQHHLPSTKNSKSV